MRTLEMPTGTYNATRERVAAIAWATNRRGRAPWKGDNVTRTICDYLIEHGYQIDMRQVLVTLQKIRDTKFGYMKYLEGERRVTEFGFFPDVNLTGFSLPERRNGTQKIMEEAVDVNAEVLEVKPVVSAGAPKTFIPPPLPAAPKVLPYHLEDLVSRLESWAEVDPESYANWVDAAIESLDANT